MEGGFSVRGLAGLEPIRRAHTVAPVSQAAMTAHVDVGGEHFRTGLLF